MDCGTAATVMVTVALTRCGGFVLSNVTTAEYVPGASPAGFAVTLTGTGAAAVAVPDAGVARSHGALTEARNSRAPPPALATVTVRASAAD